MVHLGVGAFHRAHQAWYFERLNRLQPNSPWLIRGASLRSETAARQLNPQDGLYFHVARSAEGSNISLVRSLVGVVNAFENPAVLATAIASANTELVTLTITEKGYCLNASNRRLNLDDPAVKTDLKNLDHPRTAIGFLVAGLQQRKRSHGKPLTVLSCDNLSHNGDLSRQAVMAMAAAHDTALANWIADNVSFPNSMVDRIAPAVTQEDREQIQQLSGVEDDGVAVTEQFSQWVVEDNFRGEKPALDLAGVIWVDDVAAWELRKLRLLNAAHTALACLGSWLDFKFVHEANADPRLAAFIATLWQECASTLSSGVVTADPTIDSTFDLSEYLASLRQRFSNPHLAHALAQIATDSSQKLPQRILAPLQERLAQNQPVPALTTTVAAWMCIQGGLSQSRATIPFSDPLSKTLSDVLAKTGDCHRSRAAVIIEHYPPLAALCQNPTWQDQLITVYSDLQQGTF